MNKREDHRGAADGSSSSLAWIAGALPVNSPTNSNGSPPPPPINRHLIIASRNRYGTVNRLDIPAKGRTASTSYTLPHFLPFLSPAHPSYLPTRYAFVEFVNARDAEDAYNRIHGRRFKGATIKVEVWKPNSTCPLYLPC